MSQPAEASKAQKALDRYLAPCIALLVAVVLGAVILNVYSGKASDAAAGLASSLVWPSFALIILLYFRAQAELLISTLISKVDAAGKITAGPVILEAGPRQIPVPKTGEPVTLRNVALLHTSFSRPDKTREFNDGLDYYQIEVVVIAPNPTLDRIASVKYKLDPTYTARKNYEITDRHSRFKIKELANGTSIICAEVTFKDGAEPVYLNRFIDLRASGPRI